MHLAGVAGCVPRLPPVPHLPPPTGIRSQHTFAVKIQLGSGVLESGRPPGLWNGIERIHKPANGSQRHCLEHSSAKLVQTTRGTERCNAGRLTRSDVRATQRGQAGERTAFGMSDEMDVVVGVRSGDFRQQDIFKASQCQGIPEVHLRAVVPLDFARASVVDPIGQSIAASENYHGLCVFGRYENFVVVEMERLNVVPALRIER